LKPKKQVFLILTILAVLLVGSMFLASAFGAVFILPLDIAKMSLNKLPFVNLEPTWQPTHEIIFFQIRLLRVVGGALIGAALATAGPLADPYIIGTSSGALFGATLVIIFIPATLSLWGFGLISIAAFLGALGAVFLVYNLALVAGKTPIVSLVLAGFAVGAFFTAVTWFMLSVSGEFQHKLGVVFDFLIGAIRVNNWLQIAVAACLILSGIVLARVERDKLMVLGLGSFLTAWAVSLGGLIGFVGLVTPHAMRLILGPDHRVLLPAAALAGASFLVLADLGARTGASFLVLADLGARIIFAPTELRLGILTALIGAPFFIYLLRRYRKEYAF